MIKFISNIFKPLFHLIFLFPPLRSYLLTCPIKGRSKRSFKFINFILKYFSQFIKFHKKNILFIKDWLFQFNLIIRVLIILFFLLVYILFNVYVLGNIVGLIFTGYCTFFSLVLILLFKFFEFIFKRSDKDQNLPIRVKQSDILHLPLSIQYRELNNLAFLCYMLGLSCILVISQGTLIKSTFYVFIFFQLAGLFLIFFSCYLTLFYWGLEGFAIRYFGSKLKCNPSNKVVVNIIVNYSSAKTTFTSLHSLPFVTFVGLSVNLLINHLSEGNINLIRSVGNVYIKGSTWSTEKEKALDYFNNKK